MVVHTETVTPKRYYVCQCCCFLKGRSSRRLSQKRLAALVGLVLLADKATAFYAPRPWRRRVVCPAATPLCNVALEGQDAIKRASEFEAVGHDDMEAVEDVGHDMHFLVKDEKNNNLQANGESQESHNEEEQQPNRFHDDMRRVLARHQSQPGLSSSLPFPSASTDIERDRRPVILEDDVDGAERVYAMLQHMIQIQQATEQTFQIVMQAFLKRGRHRWRRTTNLRGTAACTIVCAADIVHELLEQLHDISSISSVSIETYRLALQAYAICSTPRGDRRYAERAQALVEQVPGLSDDAECLMHLVHAWSWQQPNLRPGSCAEQAENILTSLEALTQDPHILLPCYDWVLEAWSKSSQAPNTNTSIHRYDSETGEKPHIPPSVDIGCAADRASLIWNDLKAISNDHYPNAQTYTNMILAWCKSTHPKSVDRAKGFLQEQIVAHWNREGSPLASLVEPQLIAFHGLIVALTRKGAPDQAEEILWWLKSLCKGSCRHLQPTTMTFNLVLHALVSGNKIHSSSSTVRGPRKEEILIKSLRLVEEMEKWTPQCPLLKPDILTYNCLIKAWIQSDRPDKADQATQLLMKMEHVSQEQTHEKSREAVKDFDWDERRQKERRSSSFSPSLTNRSFNVVLNAYAKKSLKDPSAARKALSLLQHMEERRKGSDSKHCNPDIISYTSVMECFGKSNHPQALRVVLGLWKRALELSQSYPATMTPNVRTFTMVILALSNHPMPGNLAKARSLLSQLIDMYENKGKDDESKMDDSRSIVGRSRDDLRPNAYAYNYVLKCAANSVIVEDDHVEAFRVACETYREMRRYAQPDSYTYAFWIKCCNNLLPPGRIRTQFVRAAFEDCRKEGLVTPHVLSRLRQGSPPDVVDKLLLDSERLPRSRNARRKTGK